MKNTISIILCSDENFTQHLCVTLCSIYLSKNDTNNLNIYIIDSGITLKSKKKLINFAKRYNNDLFFIKPTTNIFGSMHHVESANHISNASYMRLLIPELVPHLEKILYLDCDIIVRNSLWDLFNTEFNHKSLVAVSDVVAKENCKRLGISSSFNSGVMLLDLKKWRIKNISKRLIEWYEHNKEKILWADQDVLNSVLCNDWKEINPTWNTQVTQYHTTRNKVTESNIIHYISKSKPWNILFMEPLYPQYYFYYLKKTPWRIFAYKTMLSLMLSITKSSIHTLFNKGLRNSRQNSIKNLRSKLVSLLFTSG